VRRETKQQLQAGQNGKLFFESADVRKIAEQVCNAALGKAFESNLHANYLLTVSA
jgi:hypothetical protein